MLVFLILVSTRLFETRYDKIMLIVITVIISVLLSDTMINQVSDFLAPQLISDFGIGMFCAFGIIFGITQYFILDYCRRSISYFFSSSSSAKIVHKAVTLIQYSLLVIVSFLIGQILFTSSYSIYLLAALTAISYFLNIILMAYFANKFLRWYFSHKYSVIVLIYGVSFVLISAFSVCFGHNGSL